LLDRDSFEVFAVEAESDNESPKKCLNLDSLAYLKAEDSTSDMFKTHTPKNECIRTRSSTWKIDEPVGTKRKASVSLSDLAKLVEEALVPHSFQNAKNQGDSLFEMEGFGLKKAKSELHH
jgi:hypothetical protein